MPEVKNTLTDPSPILAFVEAAQARGWAYEPCGQRNVYWEANPKALEVNGSTYPTLQTPCGVVRIGLDSIPLYYHNGRVWRGCTLDVRHDLIVIAAIVVRPEGRRQGLATEAMRQLLAVADEAGFTIELEAAPIPAFRAKGKRTIGARKLIAWYKSLGFSPKYPDEGNSILVR